MSQEINKENEKAPRHLMLARAKQCNRVFFDSADHVLTNGKGSGVSVLKTNANAQQGHILKPSSLSKGGSKSDESQNDSMDTSDS